MFRHLKLEFALAIPALNEWKIEANIQQQKGYYANVTEGIHVNTDITTCVFI